MKMLYDYLKYLEFVKLDVPHTYCDETLTEVWINWECQIAFIIAPGQDIRYLSDNELDEEQDTKLTDLLTEAYIEQQTDLAVAKSNV